MAFKVTLDATLLAVMTDYTGKVIEDAVSRLADKYGFDADEAKQFLAAGGIVVKYPPLEREKLPWTGYVRPDCCKAIKKNGGLFTQCTSTIHDGNWCKPCGKEVLKKGKPSCGTVQDRLATDVLDYQVGPFKVKPYSEYIKKHGIPREQIDQACADYGISIDPRQFEVKKRPRKPRDMAAAVNAEAPSFEAFANQAEEDEDAMTAATGADPEEQIESDEEDDYDSPGTGITVANFPPELAEEPIQTTNTPAPAPPAPTPTPPIAPPANAAPIAPISKESISSMDKATLHAHCKARGIDVNAKGVVQLKRELSAAISQPRETTENTAP